MPIGTSNGMFFEDEFQRRAAPFLKAGEGIWIPSKEDIDNNVKTPTEVDYDKFTTEVTQDPVLGDGTKVSYKQPLESPTEATGALKSSEGSQTPEENKKGSTGLPELPGALGRLSFINAFKGMMNPSFDEDKEILKGMWQSAKSAFMAPGDAMKGRFDPTSEEGVRRAFEMAGWMVGAPAPVASKLADGTLGSFAGVRSRTFSKPALELAKTAEGQAFPRDEIYAKTGWFRGPDRAWKYEINDKDARLTGEQVTRTGNALGNILDHPELYEAYPHLKNLRVELDPNMGAGAAFSPGSRNGSVPGKIFLGPEAAKNTGTVLHEVQHAIQDYEIWPTGGSPGKAGEQFNLKYEKPLKDAAPEFADLYKKAMTNPKDMTLGEYQRYLNLARAYQKWPEYKELGNQEAKQNYTKLAGETEAFNVEERRHLDFDERNHIPPWWSAFHPEDQQIINYNSVYTDPYMKPGKLPDNYRPNKSSAKDENVSTFRKAANDNNKPDPEFLRRQAAFDRFQKTLDEINNPDPAIAARKNELIEQRAKLRDVLENRDWNDIELAQYNKLGKELFGDNHVPVDK